MCPSTMTLSIKFVQCQIYTVISEKKGDKVGDKDGFTVPPRKYYDLNSPFHLVTANHSGGYQEIEEV